MTDTTFAAVPEQPSKSWWERFSTWCSDTWTKFKAWVSDLGAKWADAFRIKERDEHGQIIGQSWFGKWVVNPTLKVMSYVGRAFIWTAKAALIVLAGALLTVAALVVALLIVILLLVIGVLLIAYRALFGIGLILATPYNAYQDREKSDRNWELYWMSWKPKYWACLTLQQVEDWDVMYRDFMDEYKSSIPFTETTVTTEMTVTQDIPKASGPKTEKDRRGFKPWETDYGFGDAAPQGA
jgi:hypothetical protein